MGVPTIPRATARRTNRRPASKSVRPAQREQLAEAQPCAGRDRDHGAPLPFCGLDESGGLVVRQEVKLRRRWLQPLDQRCRGQALPRNPQVVLAHPPAHASALIVDTSVSLDHDFRTNVGDRQFTEHGIELHVPRVSPSELEGKGFDFPLYDDRDDRPRPTRTELVLLA